MSRSSKQENRVIQQIGQTLSINIISQHPITGINTNCLTYRKTNKITVKKCDGWIESYQTNTKSISILLEYITKYHSNKEESDKYAAQLDTYKEALNNGDFELVKKITKSYLANTVLCDKGKAQYCNKHGHIPIYIFNDSNDNSNFDKILQIISNKELLDKYINRYFNNKRNKYIAISASGIYIAKDYNRFTNILNKYEISKSDF